MGKTTDELNSNLNGHAGSVVGENTHHEPRDSDNVAELRLKIEETRDDLSETIDALQEKLDPQRVKAQMGEKIHEATVGRAQHIAQTAKEKATEVGDKLCHAVAPAIDSIQKLTHGKGETNGHHGEATGSFLKPIAEQVVVVFGASSGIGRETAIQFARRGAKVVVAARSEDGLSTLVDSIHRAGGQAVFQVADVTNFEQVQAAAQKAVDEFGRLDTWVHCAAISLYATAEETTPDEFRRVLEVNLLGTVHGVQAALPHLKREERGALICISSVEGKRAFPYQSAYASSKHGVIGFLDTLRIELQHEGLPISVTNVMPAGINTPFFNHARTKLGVKPMPAPPIYQPSVVAAVILHAAEHPTRDIFAGGAARIMSAMQQVAPGAMDLVVKLTAFKSQKTGEPKPAGAPDNFQQPLPGYNKVGGDFMNKAKAKSLGTWLETHPQAKRALKGAAIGLALALLLRRR